MSWSLVRLVQLAALSSVSVLGAVSDVFIVKTGGGPGSCDGAPLDVWFNDIVSLANAASTGVAATDTDSLTYLTSFFRYGRGDTPTEAAASIQGIQAFLGGTAPPGGRPWLFCDSTWLSEQSWTDVAYDPATNQPYTDGTTVEAALGPDPGTISSQSPFYTSDLRQYLASTPGDYCSADPQNYGATQDITTPRTVTLCVANIQRAYSRAALSDIPAVTRSRVSIDSLQVQALTFYHELFHLVFGSAATDDAAVFLTPIMDTISAAQARSNPETYTFYSLAYYLGQQNTGWTFASSSSKNKRRAKRWVDNLGYMALYQPPKRNLPRNAWRA